MSEKILLIKGARQNNLKNITLALPHNKVIAVTGVSGSGKSSLAFDTIFAEGQWRFIESLSTYARLFLEKLDRPDVDEIQNIRPAIALEQKNPIRGSRSTVGTLTEIYDFLRLLYSKIATPYCTNCGKEIKNWDTSSIISELLKNYEGQKAIILFESKDSGEVLKKKGFYRIWVHGGIVDIPSTLTPPFEVVLDRLIIRDEPRLSDSIEMAWKEGEGRIKIVLIKSNKSSSFETLNFLSGNVCDKCNIELPEPYPLLFSFNHPVGACPECKGFGNILQYNEDIIIPNKSLSIVEGAIDPWEKPAYSWWKNQLIKNAEKDGINVNIPYSELSTEEKIKLFEGGNYFYGINDFFKELEGKRYKLHIRVFLSRYREPVTCNQCKGKRLRTESLSYKIEGFDIAELASMSVSDAISFFKNLNIPFTKREAIKEILRQITLKLGFLKQVGLDYLTLNRDSRTLSGGEYQRINLSNQLSSFLTGTLYVLDEPTIGLHPRDTDIISGIMSDLSKHGNTVIVVEHDKRIIESADWIIELGPGGGHLGGNIVFSGSKEDFLSANTITSRYIRGIDKIKLSHDFKRKEKIKTECKKIKLIGASGNNLKSVNLEIPLQTLTTITGVSGAGKSSLIVETLYRALAREFKVAYEFPLPYKHLDGAQYLKGVKLISQSPIGKSPRSNPVTYLKIFDLIRKVFSEQLEAKAHGYGPGFFSFNVQGGRCEACKGAGYQRIEMYFFEDLYIKCEECHGKRYKPEVLRVTYRKKNIDEVLNMTVDEAIELFETEHNIRNKLLLMKDIGLGYLRLGQPATTLSGGEAQRLKICAEMINTSFSLYDNYVNANVAKGDQIRNPHEKIFKKGYLYILDEPTIGLHFTDIKALVCILRRLVRAGNTVLLIEHNLDVISASDWIIDLGPEGGDKGGEIIFEGTPEEIIHAKNSYTGMYLASQSKTFSSNS